MHKHLIAAAIATLLLNACGDDSPKATDNQQVQHTDNHAFKPYADALDRAKGVETILQQEDDRRRQALGD